MGVIIFQWIQQIVFNGLRAKLFKPTETVTFNDVNYGVPSFMTCIEAVVFSFVFLWAYSAGEYSAEVSAIPEHAGLSRAILDAVDPRDVLAGVGKACKIVAHGLWKWWNSSSSDEAKAESSDALTAVEMSGRRGCDGRLPEGSGEDVVSRTSPASLSSDSSHRSLVPRHREGEMC